MKGSFFGLVAVCAVINSVAAQLTWTLPTSPPRAGSTAFISTTGVSILDIRNVTWEVLDTSNQVVDIAAYNGDSNSLTWDLPITLPSGEYSIRRTDNTGTYTSPRFVTTSADFSPCTAPPHYPLTLSNVSAVKFSDPPMYAMEYSSIFVNWDYVNQEWRFGAGVNPPIILEVVGITKFVVPTSQATFTDRIFASANESASSSSSAITVSGVTSIQPVAIRISFSRAGDSNRYTYYSDPFFLVPSLSRQTTCPVDLQGNLVTPGSGGSSRSPSAPVSGKSPNPSISNSINPSTPPQNGNNGGSGGSQTGAIIGGVVGGIVVIVGVIFGVFFWRRKKQSTPPAASGTGYPPPPPNYSQPGYIPPQAPYPQGQYPQGQYPQGQYLPYGAPQQTPLAPPKVETYNYGSNNSFIPVHSYSVPNSENTYVNSTVPSSRS